MDTLTQAPFYELQTYGIQALCLMLGEYMDSHRKVRLGVLYKGPPIWMGGAVA